MVAATVAAVVIAGSAMTAAAQEGYPARPIRLIVPEVVGSAADLMSRIIGQRLGEALGQPVTFENLFLEAGVEKGIKSAPDGYTLIYGSSGNLALLPHVKKVSFDPVKDLTAVARFVIQPTLIAAASRPMWPFSSGPPAPRNSAPAPSAMMMPISALIPTSSAAAGARLSVSVRRRGGFRPRGRCRPAPAHRHRWCGS
jgi:hypothetical protein